MSGSLTNTTLGDYIVYERIGKGGMGEVYRAFQQSLERWVAIKILPPEFCVDRDYVNRFLFEAKGAARLNHPNIIQIIDAGVVDDIYFYVMEFVAGKNTGDIVRQEGRLKERHAMYIIHQVAQALAFAHEMGVVHRDVKPENIMLTDRGAVKLGDLGLAKWTTNRKSAALTEVGVAVGTAYYVSPEQIRGIADVDSRADIYSLGATFYHLLSGNPPFYEGTPATIMAQHLTDPMPPLKKINPAVTRPVVDLIESMTIKDRDERIQSMRAVADVLGEWLGHGSHGVSNPAGSKSPPQGMAVPTPVDEWDLRFRTAGKLIASIFVGLVVAFFVLVIVYKNPKAPVAATAGTRTNPGNGPRDFNVLSPGEREKVFSGNIFWSACIRSPLVRKVDDVEKAYRESMIPVTEWVVGDLDRVSKTLIRLKYPNPVDFKTNNLNSVYVWALANKDRWTEASLELTPTRLSKNCDLQIQCFELRKHWLHTSSTNSSIARDLRIFIPPIPNAKLADLLKTPLSDPKLFSRIRTYVTAVETEVNWQSCSTLRTNFWSLPGAAFESDMNPNSLQNHGTPGNSVFHITEKNLGKPIEIDVTGFFRNLVKDCEQVQPGQPGKYAQAMGGRPGWIIQPVAGKGDVFFNTPIREDHFPRIIFHYRSDAPPAGE